MKYHPFRQTFHDVIQIHSMVHLKSSIFYASIFLDLKLISHNVHENKHPDPIYCTVHSKKN